MSLKNPESPQGTGFNSVVVAENVLRSVTPVPARLDPFRSFQQRNRVTRAEAGERAGQVVGVPGKNAQPFWSGK